MIKGKVKRLVILVALGVVVLFVLGLTKYLDDGLGSAANDNVLVLRGPNLAHLSSIACQFDIENICITGCIALLVLFRVLLLKIALK